MIDDEQLERIHAEIDGENTPEQSAALQRYLAAQPAARARFAELRRLADSLERLEQIEPPADLRQGVLASIRPTGRPSKADSGVLGALTGLLPARPTMLKYAYFFAAGLILGVLVQQLAVGRGTDWSDVPGLSGTMAPEMDGRFSVVEAPIEGVASVTGTVRLKQSDTLLMAEFDLTSQRATEITVGYDESRLAFLSFGQSGPGASRLSVTENEISLKHEGNQRFSVLLSRRGPAAATLEVRLYDAGELLHSMSVAAPQPR